MIIKTSNRLKGISPYYFATKLAQIEVLNASGKEVINLGIGSPDLSPPKEVLDELIRASNEKSANKYQSYRGLPSLRKAFANWYHKYMNVKLDDQSEVLPLIGSKEGIMHISMSFLEPGDQVLVPDPGYPAYRSAGLLAGADIVNYDLKENNGWKPDFNELERQDLSKVKLMWLNYPHMPTGAKADKTFFEELIHFAKVHQILICHDNPYGFILNNKPLSILAHNGAMECCVELNSLSKCFNMAGWRVGVLCGAKEYIDTVLKFKSNMDSGMYMPIQLAAIKALQLDDSWFSQLNAIYSDRRKKAWKIMDLLGCTYDEDSAGMFVWGRIPEHIRSAEAWVEQILTEASVFITPGFIFGNNGKRYIRISLCSSEEMYDKALLRIQKILTPYKIGI